MPAARKPRPSEWKDNLSVGLLVAGVLTTAAGWGWTWKQISDDHETLVQMSGLRDTVLSHDRSLDAVREKISELGSGLGGLNDLKIQMARMETQLIYIIQSSERTERTMERLSFTKMGEAESDAADEVDG